MNAEQWNKLHPVGTLVFAYPGARPEDIPSARRLVTRTRTEAKTVGLDGDGVVWVEGEGSYISLTHVDPVPEDVWEEARAAEKQAEPEVQLAPDRLSPEREAETRKHIAELIYPTYGQRDTERTLAIADAVMPAVRAALLAELAAVRAERDQALARVAELEAERHTTNEALSDAAETLRANRDRIAELERPAVEAKRQDRERVR
ncbi:hypothetical protein ACF061_01120 [Streptomyces sp. NPDC015220]|uniref:hypothetical protein n=1 Tax=Streptomyces sp. NPDC015220 TaxID=3364947 RepID=UPI0036F9043A